MNQNLHQSHENENTKNKIGIYIHWPFCESKCPYCDFNSYTTKSSPDQHQWFNAYSRQLLHFLSLINIHHYKLESIFFGGGTPSLMPSQLIDSLINLCTKHIKPTDDLEISLESNPSSVALQTFTELRAAGVNRISIGVQSFKDHHLAWLDRKHNAKLAMKAINYAADIFDNFSFDLMYCLKNQTPQSWEEELQAALMLAGDHLSLYNLTIEANTPFGKLHKINRLDIPSPEIADQIYDTTQLIMKQHNFERYEISNYAKNGAKCKHNMLYWNSDDYIGIGPGAAGRFFTLFGSRIATKCEDNPYKWLSQTINEQPSTLSTQELSNNHPILNQVAGYTVEYLPTETQLQEIIMMGTRTSTGISFAEIERRFGINIEKTHVYPKMKTLQQNGLLEINEQLKTVKTTEIGLNYASGIARILF